MLLEEFKTAVDTAVAGGFILKPEEYGTPQCGCLLTAAAVGAGCDKFDAESYFSETVLPWVEDRFQMTDEDSYAIIGGFDSHDYALYLLDGPIRSYARQKALEVRREASH